MELARKARLLGESGGLISESLRSILVHFLLLLRWTRHAQYIASQYSGRVMRSLVLSKFGTTPLSRLRMRSRRMYHVPRPFDDDIISIEGLYHHRIAAV